MMHPRRILAALAISISPVKAVRQLPEPLTLGS
jgi:hypothetical protein